jgi:hypothetical protein
LVLPFSCSIHELPPLRCCCCCLLDLMMITMH